MMVLGHPLTFEEFLRETRAERAARVFRERGMQGLIEEGLIESRGVIARPQPTAGPPPYQSWKAGPPPPENVQPGPGFADFLRAVGATAGGVAKEVLLPKFGEEAAQQNTQVRGFLKALAYGLVEPAVLAAKEMGPWTSRQEKEAAYARRTELAQEFAPDPLSALFFAAPPAAMATGGVSAGLREARAAVQAARRPIAAARPVVAEAAEKAVPAARRLALEEVGAVGKVPKQARRRLTIAEQEAARLETGRQQLAALQAAQERAAARSVFKPGDRVVVMGDERIVKSVELAPTGERLYRVEGLGQQVNERQVTAAPPLAAGQAEMPVTKTIKPAPTKDPTIVAAYDEAMRQLPPEVAADIDNVVGIRFAGLAEGTGGNTEIGRGVETLIRLERGQPAQELTKSLRHELLHSYLIKHPEIKEGRAGFLGEENAVRALERRFAAGQAEMPVAEAVAEPAPGLPIPGVRRPTEPVTPGAAWETGTSRPFAFDPNSTVNQGRFRLLPPIKGGSYITRQSGTPGVAYIVDTESNAIQSVRFNKAKFPEEQAGQWWEANKARFGRGPAEPVTPTAAEPVTAAGAAPGARQQTEDVLRIARSGTGDIPPAVEAQSAFAQAADPSGAPPGKVPPRVRRAPRPEPGPEPEGVLEAVTRQATRGERLDQTLLRRHEAAITAAENEARVFLDEGVQRLRAAKLGAMRTGHWVPREQDLPLMDELFEALHNPGKVASGEMRVPGRLEVDYARLRELTDWEEAMRIDFDPAMATVEDYFYRGWLMPKEGVPKVAAGVPRGRLGAVPAFKKPRVNATYREMRELGFEPISWNPYEQWRISRLQGVRYREQMQLIDHLKKLDLATTDAAGLGAEGWRTPRVGPAFEGKVFATTDSTGAPVAMYSRRWVVPDSLAGSLESAYGVPPSLGNVHVGKRTVDLMKVIDAVVFIPKRVKLFGSLFQQFDFLMRNYVGAWSGMVDALTAGRPVEAARRLAIWPKSAVDIVRANLSPGFRASLRQQLNSTTPLVKGRSGVHLRGIMEGGLSTIDTTILPRDLDKTARVVAEEAGLLGNKVVRRALGSIESSMRRGLFEGVYPAAQITDIKNNIAPMIVRRYGSLSDEALNGMIAQVTNKKYSTIPASQSVLQSRPLREILRRLFFSISETEGLLRQATGAIRGPEAGYWRTHYIGAYLGLIALASIIHFASTGKPLPWGRWTPVSKDKWGILPVGYNQKFAAPDLPIKGTERRNITLDMVGQLDTAFRILDPVSFLAARESVPIRASVTQLTERDYFGRPITDVGPGGIYSRTANLANDLFAPIGIGQAAGQIALREAGVPKGLIPMSERGLTTTGQLIQATGLNVRAQYLRELWEADLKPYLDIPGDDRKAEAEGKQPRDAYLNDNPEVDAKVFIIGQRESVLTYSAKLEVVRLMRENNIKVADLKSMEVRDYEKTTDERVKLRNWLLTQLREGEEAEQEAAFQAWLKQGLAYKPQREPTPVGAR